MDNMGINTLNCNNGNWVKKLDSNWIRLTGDNNDYIEVVYRDGKWEIHGKDSFTIEMHSSNSFKLKNNR